MHPLWAVPPVAFLVGIGVVLAVLGHLRTHIAGARDELGELASLRAAVDTLRTDTDRVGAAREALRHR